MADNDRAGAQCDIRIAAPIARKPRSLAEVAARNRATSDGIQPEKEKGGYASLLSM
ncbi:hypothetical protein [Chitinasiproducens palmae]|uniref:Uncharacterized protein n=1 Tax=Chitinasiproducens palmae TaxID=1770053 RepID=A0A1H2PQ02_9BURK|nr:hypothetical protein [Chitinasiproducens palmae]SDV48891.1 hypothetical protein SAMN05216551_106145 [Chitinasiproducens palmae]